MGECRHSARDGLRNGLRDKTLLNLPYSFIVQTLFHRAKSDKSVIIDKRRKIALCPIK
jgi:hypothetical protein